MPSTMKDSKSSRATLLPSVGTVRCHCSVNDILLAGDGIHPNHAEQYLVCKLLTNRIAEVLAPTSAH